MAAAFFHEMFGEASRDFQERAGSRDVYARREASADRDELTERERHFLAERTSFYLSTVTADGWPYIQHRGGAAGFVKWLGGNQIGFADFPGNKQFISLGNVTESQRVAMFFMDYPARRRLKIIGHGRIINAETEAALLREITDGIEPPAESGVVIDVVGFDWNCPKYIEQRFTRAEVETGLMPVLEENARLRAELARLKGVAA